MTSNPERSRASLSPPQITQQKPQACNRSYLRCLGFPIVCGHSLLVGRRQLCSWWSLVEGPVDFVVRGCAGHRCPRKGPALGCVLCLRHSEILSNFCTRGSVRSRSREPANSVASSEELGSSHCQGHWRSGRVGTPGCVGLVASLDLGEFKEVKEKS